MTLDEINAQFKEDGWQEEEYEIIDIFDDGTYSFKITNQGARRMMKQASINCINKMDDAIKTAYDYKYGKKLPALLIELLNKEAK